MDDLVKKLNDLLNSPEGMQKLQQAAASLGVMMGEGGGEGGSPPAEASGAPSPPAPEPASSSAVNNSAGDLDGLGDMAAIARFLPLLSGMKTRRCSKPCVPTCRMNDSSGWMKPSRSCIC